MNTKKNSGSFRTGGKTIIARACRTVPGFAKTDQTFERTLTLRHLSVDNPESVLKGGYSGWKGRCSFLSLWFERWLV